MVANHIGADRAAALEAITNPVRNRADWQHMRAAALVDPGAFHGDIAKREIHWFVATHGAHGAWLIYEETRGLWTGWDAHTAAPVTADQGAAFEPWQRAFNGDDAPHWK